MIRMPAIDCGFAYTRICFTLELLALLTISRSLLMPLPTSIVFLIEETTHISSAD